MNWGRNWRLKLRKWWDSKWIEPQQHSRHYFFENGFPKFSVGRRNLWNLKIWALAKCIQCRKSGDLYSISHSISYKIFFTYTNTHLYIILCTCSMRHLDGNTLAQMRDKITEQFFLQNDRLGMFRETVHHE